MKVACDHCGKRYAVDDHLAGKKVRCKGCGQSFSLPAPDSEDTTLDNLLPTENTAEVFQPAVTTTSRRSTPKKLDPRMLWAIGAALVLLVVVMVAVHPWSKTPNDNSDGLTTPVTVVARPPGMSADGTGQTGASAPSVPQQNATAVALGAFMVNAPPGFPTPTFEADPSDPASEFQTRSDQAGFGVITWDLTAMGNGVRDIKFIVFKREDMGHDIPVATLDQQTMQARKHDVFSGNSLQFLRLFYNDQAIVFKAYDRDCMIEIHLDCGSTAPSDAIELLEKMARSIHRIKPDKPGISDR